MNSIFIDPVIVMTPSDDETREGVEVWLVNLNTWLKEALSFHYNWLHFVRATNLLLDNGRFPSFEVLRAWQRRYKLDINPSLIVRDVNKFFRNEEFDLGGNLEKLGYLIEAEEGSIIIHPTQFTNRWLECIRNDMLQVLATTCTCKYTNHPFADDLHIATLRLSDEVREIEVSAIIVDALPDFVRGADNKIVQTFPLLFTPDDLLRLTNVLELWSQGEKGIQYAIDQEYKKRYQSSVSRPLDYRIGSHFVESIKEFGLDTNGIFLDKVVRAAAATVADQVKDIKGYKLHPLRKSETADSSQRIRSRDNAKAWRLMLEKHGAGWRLHYWQVPGLKGNMIEFSNVEKESGDRIYE